MFLLNAVALMVFPPIGQLLSIDAASFGLWSALAIHDTGAVVGASMQYGDAALQVGTTVKLTRSLWIVPLTLVMPYFVTAGSDAQRTKKPWFILGFLVVAALVTWVPAQ
jgi:uncharacterized membrane protein YadS